MSDSNATPTSIQPPPVKPGPKPGTVTRSETVLAKLRALGAPDDFPLFPHPTGRWAKKINGSFKYYGPVSDWRAALNNYLTWKDDDYAGRDRHRVDSTDVRLHKMINDFLYAKKQMVERGEMKPLTHRDYVDAGKRMTAAWGRDRAVSDLRPADFAKLQGTMNDLSPITRANEIQRVRTMFKWAYENELIDAPIRYGAEFKKPSASVIRKAKNEKPKKYFDAAEIRALLGVADTQLKAMILLGVNCGLGNNDISELNREHLDLDAGVLDYTRGKTGIERRAKLWPETVKALRDVLTWADSPILNPKNKGVPHYHPEIAEDKNAVFLTRQQVRFVRRGGKVSDFDSVAQAFGKACRAAGVKREGVGFYALRHVTETIGGRAGDQGAVNRIMGHADDTTIDGTYRTWMRDAAEDARLAKVAEHIRLWLWPNS